MLSQVEQKMVNPKRSLLSIKSKLLQKKKTKDRLAPNQIIDKARHQLDTPAGLIQTICHLEIYIHPLTTVLLEKKNQCAQTEPIPAMLTLTIHHLK